MNLFAFILLSLFGFTLHNNSMAQDTIYWSPVNRLTWENFKGIPDTTMGYEALTFSGIECKYSFADNSFTYHVAAFFLSKKSWKMPWADNYALYHEQLHFDITEVFARKLRAALSPLKPDRKTVKKAVRDIVQKINDEKEAMQNLYDDETDFGRKPDSQQEWQKKISELLANPYPLLLKP